MSESGIVRILKWLIYAVAFVPLVIFSQFLSPFHFGKVVVFRSLVEIMAVFYFVLILKDKKYLPPRHILLYLFAGWVLLFGLTTLTSINPYFSFWGSLERMGGWWTFAHYFVYFVILISVFRTRDDWFRLLKLMVFVGVLSAFYGFLQKTSIEWIVGGGGRQRIFGTIGNPALFAGYQIVNLFLALMLSLSSSVSPRYKPFFWFAAFINFIAISMTAVRGSILGMGLGFIVFAALMVLASKSRMAKRILIGLVGLAILFFVFSSVFRNSQFVQNSGYLRRLTDFSLKTYTVQTRFWAWRAGLEGWKETPKTILLGWGPENFNIPFSKHFNPKFFKGPGSETLFDRAHNMFFEILITMGLLTFLVYVALFVFIYRLLWKLVFKKEMAEGRGNNPPPKIQPGRPGVAGISNGADKIIGISLISLITAYIVHNCFIFDTSANFIVFFTVLGFISWLTPSKKVDKLGTAENEINRDPKSYKPEATSYKLSNKLGIGLRTLTLVLLIGAVFLIYKTNVLPAKANYATTRAIIRGWANDFDGALAKYKEALSYDVPGKYDFRHRFAQYILDYTSGRKIEEKERSALLFAIEEVQKNIKENKEDYLPYLYASRIFINLGRDDPNSPYNDEALKNSMKALEISPTFVRTYYEVAQAYLNKKDYNNAIKYFNEAVKLNPEVGLSYWYLGVTYLEAGEFEKGFSIVEEAKKIGYVLDESDYRRLINVYLKLGNFGKIAEIYEVLIKINPKNPQYHASLAVAYSKIGKIDEAVSEARKAVELDKTFEKEAKAFVKSLGREF